MPRQPRVERISRLIAQIYDSVVEPDRWEATLSSICDELAFVHCVLGIYRQPAGTPFAPRLRIAARLEQSWLDRQYLYGPEMVEYWGGADRLQNLPLDEPAVASHAATATLRSNRFVTEWLAPQRIIDLVAVTSVRNARLFGGPVFSRHEQAGAVTETEIGALRLLGPHFRRAVEIADLLDVKALEAASLASTLETIAAGILLVDEAATPVHANPAARAMLDTGDPIRLDQRRLKLPTAQASAALIDAITRAARDEPELGQRGIGIPARRRDGSPSVVHVLPLRRGDIRPGLERRAVAAVFVAPASTQPQMPAAALALLYDLTPAETRIVGLISEGVGQAEIAARLGITQNTVKTHLKRVFAKTGTSRRAEVVRLIASLSLPL